MYFRISRYSANHLFSSYSGRKLLFITFYDVTNTLWKISHIKSYKGGKFASEPIMLRLSWKYFHVSFLRTNEHVVLCECNVIMLTFIFNFTSTPCDSLFPSKYSVMWLFCVLSTWTHWNMCTIVNLQMHLHHVVSVCWFCETNFYLLMYPVCHPCFQ
jgi:hypothetical protein